MKKKFHQPKCKYCGYTRSCALHPEKVIMKNQEQTKHNNIPNGTYRIKFSSGPADREVTVIAEGRDGQTLSKEDAAFIVRAVNNFEALVDALQRALSDHKTETWDESTDRYIRDTINQAEKENQL